MGDRIENRVGIYFDYNAPIITNTVLNTLADSLPNCFPVALTEALPDDFQLYPNPNQGNFFLEGNWVGDVTVEVFQLNGQRIYREVFLDAGKISVAPTAATGLHLVRVRDASGRVWHRKVWME